MADHWAPDPFPLFQRNGTPDDMNALDANIEAVADTLIAALDYAKAHPVAKAPNRLKPEDVRYLAYALAVHRARNGKALTEDHLRLLAAALAIARPSLKAAEFVGVAPVKDLATFIKAADIEASAPEISENGLPRQVKVDNKTIRSWRRLPQWRQRVRATRYWNGNPTDEDRAIARSWAAVIQGRSNFQSRP
jgi:hypothetical protein